MIPSYVYVTYDITSKYAHALNGRKTKLSNIIDDKQQWEWHYLCFIIFIKIKGYNLFMMTMTSII